MPCGNAACIQCQNTVESVKFSLWYISALSCTQEKIIQQAIFINGTMVSKSLSAIKEILGNVVGGSKFYQQPWQCQLWVHKWVKEEIRMLLQIRRRLRCMTHISSMRKIEDPPSYWKVLAVREKRWSWWFHNCYIVAPPSVGLNLTRAPTFPLPARLQHWGWHLWGQPSMKRLQMLLDQRENGGPFHILPVAIHKLSASLAVP